MSSVNAAYDLAVVGSGPAGCAAAAAALRLGGRVAVFDGTPAIGPIHHPLPTGEEAAPGTPRLIEEIFGQERRAFRPERHTPCPSTVSAWGNEQTEVSDHLFNPLGTAWNLDRRRFDEDLRVAVEELGAERRRERVLGVERSCTGWALRSQADGDREAQRVTRAKIVVDASGRRAGVARQLGARQHHLDRLVALWSVWSVDASDRSSALHVEAVAGGWWYSTLVPGHRRVVVYLTDVDLLPSGPLGRRRLAYSAPGLALIGSLFVLSREPAMVAGPSLATARSSWLEPPTGDGWLAAGDAACTIDPLAGRGIVSALLSGRGAGEAAMSNRPDAGLVYDDLVRQLVADGRRQHADAYLAEQRWADRPFWRRRHDIGRPFRHG